MGDWMVNSLLVFQVPFEVLIRRQIARLLDPSLQCLRFVYDELVKMSRACEATELQRFPFLRRRMDEVMGKFLRDGVKPAERMIVNLIEMEMDYINSSNPNFLGGSKAVEIAMQQLRSSQPWRLKCPKYQPRRKNLAKGLLQRQRREVQRISSSLRHWPRSFELTC
ncbi:dynamin-related protein 3B-like [Quercus robur]|uniref:dynamin-related protein 3B-like n=1 Tax=Quercus robur TaxID=38942 RepID=UPI0021612CF0|nr:dynamin-related protein 3B-like [Quercus robur]